MDPILELRNLSKARTGSDPGSICSLSLTLLPGEAVVLFHMPHWERKWLIDVISGLEDPDAGGTYFRGVRLDRADEKTRNLLRKCMGIVTDPPIFLNNVKIMENLRLPMRYQSGGSGRSVDDRLAEVLHDLGLEGLPDVIPSRLDPPSLGAAALGRALATLPDLLVVERPEECLARRLVSKLPQLWVKYVLKGGGAVLVMTGVPRLATVLSDRIAVFDKGTVASIEDRDSFKIVRESMETDWSASEEEGGGPAA